MRPLAFWGFIRSFCPRLQGMPETQIVLGFDVSLNRLGVAIGNRITKDARPLVQINHADKSQRFAQIAALIDQWEPEALVVGNACAMWSAFTAVVPGLRGVYLPC
ncbi:MAG: Holliday junction resolvase RuvX [Betaproteobacteria bacterium]|nr:Holliday junction resolvase RuvX [Betaproteobacteria bacterium]